MSNDGTFDPRVKGTPISDGQGSPSAVDQMANVAVPVYVALRAMKGRGVRVLPGDLATGKVIRVDGMKYRVMDDVWTEGTGSIAVDAYSEDNQRETLFLSAKEPVRVIGNLP